MYICIIATVARYNKKMIDDIFANALLANGHYNYMYGISSQMFDDIQIRTMLMPSLPMVVLAKLYSMQPCTH